MRGRSPLKVAAAVAVLTLVMTGCSANPSTPGPITNAVISISISEPQHLIPSNTNETSGGEVDNALWTGLVDFDASNKPVMAAAESLHPSSWMRGP